MTNESLEEQKWLMSLRAVATDLCAIVTKLLPSFDSADDDQCLVSTSDGEHRAETRGT